MRALSMSGTQWIAGRIGGVALLIALVLGLDLAASCSTLHQRLCPNAGKPGDSCAIAAFAGGALSGSPAPVVLTVVVLGVILAARWTDALFPSAPVFQLSPSRAPPQSVRLPG